MKRKERHHLRENELVHLFESLRDTWETRQREIGIAAMVLVVAVVAGIGIVALRQREQSQGTALLAEARVVLNTAVAPAGVTDPADGLPLSAQLGATGSFPSEAAKLTAALPKLQAAADAYPGSRAGIEARYYLGGALAALGRYDESIQAFDEVIRRAGENGLYGRMARLGRAGALVDAGQLDEAVTAWTELSTMGDTYPPDAVLMGLARAYAAKGDTEQARQTLTEIVDRYPDSPYTFEAREELDTL
jgi:tetratricopeptide (TPR) repeat protein